MAQPVLRQLLMMSHHRQQRPLEDGPGHADGSREIDLRHPFALLLPLLVASLSLLCRSFQFFLLVTCHLYCEMVELDCRRLLLRRLPDRNLPARLL